jgi:hypothetical protein
VNDSDSILGKGKKFFFSPQSRDPSVAHPACTGTTSFGVKWPRHEFGHSPSSSTESKNGGDTTPLTRMTSWRLA